MLFFFSSPFINLSLFSLPSFLIVAAPLENLFYSHLGIHWNFTENGYLFHIYNKNYCKFLENYLFNLNISIKAAYTLQLLSIYNLILVQKHFSLSWCYNCQIGLKLIKNVDPKHACPKLPYINKIASNKVCHNEEAAYYKKNDVIQYNWPMIGQYTL